MCYSIGTGTEIALKYAKHRGDDKAYIKELEDKLEELRKHRDWKSYYAVSGFAHPHILVFTNEAPHTPQLFEWGLIPSWVKTKKDAMDISNKTLNCRSESMFEKPSFKPSAMHRRCLIYVDGFYEHHHLKSKTYPFHISANDDSPLVFGGLWNEWLDKETSEIIKTVTIVTCEGNEAMKIIHNNPKADGPRMPFIIPKELQDYWLDSNTVGEEELQEFIKPYPSDLLQYHTVQKLLGKAALGNVPEAEQEYIYEELRSLNLV